MIWILCLIYLLGALVMFEDVNIWADSKSSFLPYVMSLLWPLIIAVNGLAIVVDFCREFRDRIWKR